MTIILNNSLPNHSKIPCESQTLKRERIKKELLLIFKKTQQTPKDDTFRVSCDLTDCLSSPTLPPQERDSDRLYNLAQTIQTICQTSSPLVTYNQEKSYKKTLSFSLQYGEKIENYAIDLPYLRLASENTLSKPILLHWNKQIYQLTKDQEEVLFEKLNPLKFPNWKGIEHYLDGRSYESISRNTVDALGDSFWDHWKTTATEAAHCYRTSIYPLCMKYITYFTTTYHAPLQVLEICGGDGELAAEILRIHQTRIHTYSLCDLNEASLGAARSRLQNYSHQSRVFKANVIKDPLSNFSEKANHLILAVGAFTHGVLPSRKDALSALDHTLTALESGGHLLMTGFEDSWIYALDLEKRGLTVMNTYAAEIGRHFYIAKSRL